MCATEPELMRTSLPILILHLFFTGIVRYAIKDTVKIVKNLGGDAAVHLLDVRAMNMHRYLSFTAR